MPRPGHNSRFSQVFCRAHRIGRGKALQNQGKSVMLGKSRVPGLGHERRSKALSGHKRRAAQSTGVHHPGLSP